MKSLKYTWIIALTYLLSTLLGCTRPQSDVSKLKISVPAFKHQSLSPLSAQISHLVINVTGPGISSPLFFEWDRKNGQNAPAEFSPVLEVPVGSDRLIQVLAVYEDDTTSKMDFHYGDAVASLSLPEETVTILAKNLNQTADIVSGSISGRLITSASGAVESGPTGEVHIKFQPPNARPPMILDRSMIINGWFSFFGLTGVDLLYQVVQTGQILFDGQPKNLLGFTPSDQVVRTMIPVHKYNDFGNVEVANPEPEIHVLGYFGTPAVISGKRVCYSLSPSSISSLYQYNLAATSGNELGLSRTLPAPTIAELRDISAPMTSARQQGGVRDNTAPCDTLSGSEPANLYSNSLFVSAMNFGNGRDQVGGFTSPFGFVDDANPTNFQLNGQSLAFGDAGGIAILSGRLLPGASSTITGILFYQLPAPAPGAPFPDREVSCSQLASGAFGAVFKSENAPNTDGTFVANTQIQVADLDNGASAAMCLRSALGVLPRGILIDSGGGGGGPMGKYLRIESDDPTSGGFGDDLLLTLNYCHPVRLKVYDNSNPTAVNTDTTISGLPTTGDLRFYSDSTCSTPEPSKMILNGTSESTVTYVRGTATNTGHSLTFSMTGDSVTFQGSNNRLVVNQPKLMMEHPYYIGSGSCNKYRIRTLHANGNQYPQDGAGITPTFTMANSSIIAGSESLCGSAMGGFSLNIGSSNSSTEFWTSSTGTAMNISMNVTYPGFDTYSATPYRGVAQELHGVYLRYILRATPEVGKCIPVRVALVNLNGIEATARNPIPVSPSVTSMNATFHQDPGCYGPLPGNTSIPAGESAIEIFMRPLNTSALAFTPQNNSLPLYPDSSPTASLGGNYISLTPPVFLTKTLGSHEFGATRAIPLATPGGAVIFCSKSVDGINWNICPVGTMSGGNLNWTLADAVASTRFQISSSVTGQLPIFLMFDPKAVYGPDFQVINCDSVVSANTSGSALNTSLSTNDYICLNSGVTVDCDAQINVGWNQALVGHSSRNSFTQTTTTGLNCINIVPQAAMSGTTAIANMTFNLNSQTCTSGSQVGINVSGNLSGGGLYVVSMDNNGFIINPSASCPSKGISIFNNISTSYVNLKDSAFNLVGTNDGAIGVYAANNHQGPINLIRNSVVATVPTYNTVVLFQEQVTGGNPSSQITLDQNSVVGPRILVLKNLITTATGSPTMKFTRNNIDINQEPINAHIINIAGGNNHEFKSNKIKFMQAASYSFANISNSGNQTVSVNNNRFVHLTAGQIFSTFAQSATNIGFQMDQNSFLSLSTTSAGNSRVVNLGGVGTTQASGLGLPDALSGNLACETDAGNGWSGAPMNISSGALSGLSVPAPITPNFETCY